MVLKTQYFECPEIRVLKGDKAIQALKEYINELNGSKPEELTGVQAKVMIELSEGLISAIEGETTALANIKQPDFMLKFQTRIKRHISRIFRELMSQESPSSSRTIHNYSPPLNQQVK